MTSLNKGKIAVLLTVGAVSGLRQLPGVFAHNNVNEATNTPKAFVVIEGKKNNTVINGYQWSVDEGAVTKAVIADAAFDPARNLHPIRVKAGAVAHMMFQQNPKTVQLDMWEHGTKYKQYRLNGTSFALPNKAGDYTYEITGYWGKDYIQYDFELQVH